MQYKIIINRKQNIKTGIEPMTYINDLCLNLCVLALIIIIISN